MISTNAQIVFEKNQKSLYLFMRAGLFDRKAIGQKMCRKKHINVLKGIRSKKGLKSEFDRLS